ncbi:unnamed protein product, partial [Lymnaea stagnalis]
MSSYCQLCSTTGKAMLKNSDTAYQNWYATHKERCTINHSGSAGLMEVEGDMAAIYEAGSLVFTLILSVMKIVRHIINCFLWHHMIVSNHVAKRLGSVLRNFVPTESKFGTTLGGRKAGSLTRYKKAVASKVSSSSELQQKIMTTFYHASSTNEEPKHHSCPAGKSSWWFWQRAIAYKSPPSHNSSSLISPMVAGKINSIYERLSTD